jgi:hypothetical protein
LAVLIVYLLLIGMEGDGKDGPPRPVLLCWAAPRVGKLRIVQQLDILHKID